MQQPDGTFVEASVAAGVASDLRGRGAVFGDLNGDGLLDLAVVNRRAPMELWQNVSVEAGNWITLQPVQPAPNQHAVGGFAEIRLPDGTTRIKEITVGGGHAGGSALPVHFGLGSATSVETRMIWPDGTASDWQVGTINAANLISRVN
jgi:hypothetical protein